MFKRIERRRARLALLGIVMLCLVAAGLPVMAGEGDGSGGGQAEALTLVASDPADGQKDVSVPLTIRLTFNKNVVNMAVKENNSTCFSLASADGTKIPITTILADDQMEPEKKREISVRPRTSLRPAVAYTLTIAPELKAKSGSTLGKKIAISFETAQVDPVAEKKTVAELPAAAPAQQPVPSAPVETNPERKELEPAVVISDLPVTGTNPAPPPAVEIQSGKSDAVPTESKTEEKDEQPSAAPMVAGVLVAAGFGVIAWYLLKKRS